MDGGAQDYQVLSLRVRISAGILDYRQFHQAEVYKAYAHQDKHPASESIAAEAVYQNKRSYEQQGVAYIGIAPETEEEKGGGDYKYRNADPPERQIFQAHCSSSSHFSYSSSSCSSSSSFWEPISISFW